MTRKNHGNHIKRPIGSYSEILKEYRSLALRPELTEIEAKRLEHILEAACSDDMLSLLINEVDEALFDAQEPSEHHNYHEIQNEAARTVELIGGKIPCHKNIFASSKLNLAAYEPTLKEYSQLLQVSTLSEADATHMEQILETAYEDELLALLLDTIDGQLEGMPKVAQIKPPKPVQIVAPSRKHIAPRRRRSAKSVIESVVIACSLLLAAAPLVMNLQPQTSRQQEQLTSSNDFSVDQPSELNVENSNISLGEEVLVQMAPESAYQNDLLQEEIIVPKGTDNSLNPDIDDLFSFTIEFKAEATEPRSREVLPPQEASIDIETAIDIPALETTEGDTEHDFVIPSYDLPEIEKIENENSEEAPDNDLPESVRPDTNQESGPSDVNHNLNGFPDKNHSLEIADRQNNPNQIEGSEEEQKLQQGHNFETHFISIDRLNNQETPQGSSNATVSNPVGSGGTIRVLGNDSVIADNSRVNTSDRTDDGTALIGGTFQGQGTVSITEPIHIDNGSIIPGPTTGSGDGGQVIVWAESLPHFYGDIATRGATSSGNSGFVEISGQGSLAFQGIVDTSMSNGTAGDLLLDPENIRIFDTSEGDVLLNSSSDIQVASIDAAGDRNGSRGDITINGDQVFNTTGTVSATATNSISRENNSIQPVQSFPGSYFQGDMRILTTDVNNDNTNDEVVSNDENIHLSAAFNIILNGGNIFEISPELEEVIEPNNLSANGVYLFGEKPLPDQLQTAYFIFEIQDDELIGAFYAPHSSFDCAVGQVQNTHLALTITETYTQESYSYEIERSTQIISANQQLNSIFAFELQSWHRIDSFSDNDLRMLSTCQTYYESDN
ncbi:hypothetical protein QGP82_22140 [Leptothoe sp. LEGE 181152]|nr:hypothetical protein [Leptothoe sp. LEGE 181152]